MVAIWADFDMNIPNLQPTDLKCTSIVLMWWKTCIVKWAHWA